MKILTAALLLALPIIGHAKSLPVIDLDKLDPPITAEEKKGVVNGYAVIGMREDLVYAAMGKPHKVFIKQYASDLKMKNLAYFYGTNRHVFISLMNGIVQNIEEQR
jgi:hypothetical protein